MKNVKTLLIFSSFAINGLFAQTVFEQDAYLSNLNSFQFFNKDIASFIQIPDQWNDQQFHLRWNTCLYHGEHWMAKMSLRNRIFTGYQWQEDLFGFRDALEEDALGASATGVTVKVLSTFTLSAKLLSVSIDLPITLVEIVPA